MTWWAYALAGALAGVLLLGLPARHAWTRGAGALAGLAMAGVLATLVGEPPRVEAFALLAGLLLPAALREPTRVPPAGVAAGAVTGFALALASDTLLALGALAVVGLSALWSLWRARQEPRQEPMRSTSNE